MKFSIVLVLYSAMSLSVFGQQEGLNPNRPYENFSKAYETLDSQILMDTYTENAALLNLYDSSNPNSIKGVVAIKNYFEEFFQRFKASGQKLSLSFKITDRQKIEEVIYDNGFYKLTISSTEEADHTGYGKLSTILVLDGENWKFSIDSNTNTTRDEFENAATGSILQPN